jgi:hypothetical protein
VLCTYRDSRPAGKFDNVAIAKLENALELIGGFEYEPITEIKRSLKYWEMVIFGKTESHYNVTRGDDRIIIIILII